MLWTKSQGIWSMLFKVRGSRFIFEVSPRFDMSDMDTPVDLDKIHEHQLLLCRGPDFNEKDDIFLGYYPDRLMAAHAGMQMFHYMNGKLIRKPNRVFLAIAVVAGLIVLLALPSKTNKVEITTITQQEPVKSPPPPPPSERKPK